MASQQPHNTWNPYEQQQPPTTSAPVASQQQYAYSYQPGSHLPPPPQSRQSQGSKLINRVLSASGLPTYRTGQEPSVPTAYYSPDSHQYSHQVPSNQAQHAPKPSISPPSSSLPWPNNQPYPPYESQHPVPPPQPPWISIWPQQGNTGNYTYYPSAQPLPTTQGPPLPPPIPPRPSPAVGGHTYDAAVYAETWTQQPIQAHTSASHFFVHSQGPRIPVEYLTSASTHVSSGQYVTELPAESVGSGQSAGFTSNVSQLSTPPPPQPSGPSFPYASPPAEAPFSDSLGSLMPQFSNLSVSSPARPRVLVPEYDDLEFPYLIPSEPRFDGEPNEIQKECPKSRQVDYQTFWYCLSEAPESLICTHCHNKFISATALQGSFRKVEKTSGRCRFNVPRILLYIWPQAQRSQSTHALAEFMIRRLAILDCKGWGGTMLRDGIKFFSPTSSSPKGFVGCEACYEDEVLRSPFAGYFAPTTSVLGPAGTWYCCFSGALFGRLFRKYSQQPGGWDHWTREAEKRIFLPRCDGKGSIATSRRWYRVRGLNQSIACEACYLDRAGGTRFADSFELVSRLPRGTVCTCLLKVIPVVVSWQVSQMSRDYNVFGRTANAFLTNPTYSVTGSKGGSFYRLRGSTVDFCICVVCFTGIVQSMRADRSFELANYDAKDTITSDFTPDSPRFAEYIHRLTEAYETGVWSRFSAYVYKWASVPPCTKDMLGPGIFYGFGEGFPDIVACQKCYEEVIQMSPFDSRVVHRGETQLNGDPLKAICSFFSPRMRSRWADACASGDFDVFMAFAKLRIKVWCETIPQMQIILAQQKMTQQRAMTSALAGVAYQVMENIRLAASDHRSDRLYGSSSLGWHETQNGATAARYNQEMMSDSAQVANGDVWTLMLQLESRWKEVL